MNAQVNFLSDPIRLEIKAIVQEAMTEVLAFAPPKQEEDLIDIFDVAKLTKLKNSTIYVKCCRNQLPHFKKGGKLYFSKAAILDYIKSGKRLSGLELQATLDTQFLKK